MIFAPLRLKSYPKDGRTNTWIDVGKHNTSPLTWWGLNITYQRRILLVLQRFMHYRLIALNSRRKFHKPKFGTNMYSSDRIAFPFCCYSNRNFWLAKKILFSYLYFRSLSWTLSDRRTEFHRIDGRLTCCPLEHLNHLVIICAAIALFVATRVC